MNGDYNQFLNAIREAILRERNNAARSINRSLIALYWEIGQRIKESQEAYSWGKSIVERLSKDLQGEFPSKNGFSARNLWEMRRLYETYKDSESLHQLIAEVPWGHHLLIMQKAKNEAERGYYLKASSEMAWSRDVLLNQIKAQAYERQLVYPKLTNFRQTLTEYLAKQAEETIKSTYNFEFLGIAEPVLEQELERQLIVRLKEFLLELGYGFTFVGQQYPLHLGEKTYRVDLLFFHRKLQCLVAFDLKVGGFKPEYAGKMNFYLELLDEQVRLPKENPSIGVILCAEKDDLEVEYALRISTKPMGVAEYQLSQQLPKELSGQLPSPEELREELRKAVR